MPNATARANNYPTSNWRCSQHSGRRGKRNGKRQTEREAANAGGAEDDDDNEAGKPGVSSATPGKKPGGRQALPRHLKRERIVRDLADKEKRCARCAQDLRHIGEETCERYEYGKRLRITMGGDVQPKTEPAA